MNKTKITKQTEIADSVNEEEEDQPIQDYLYQNRNKEQNKQCSSTVPTPKQIMKIELDEKRIMLEHKYSLEKMWDLVDEICSKTFFTKISRGYYKLNDNEFLPGAMLVLARRFENIEGLLSYFSIWLAGEDDEHLEDYLSAYKDAVHRLHMY